MKKYTFYFGIVAILFACALSFSACSNDDDASDIVLTYGTWVCIASTDTQGSTSYKDLFVGETLTINTDKTYSSSSSDLGRSGTWSISGHTFTAKSSNGKTINATYSVSSTTLKLSGKASNGFNFNYTFKKTN